MRPEPAPLRVVVLLALTLALAGCVAGQTRQAAETEEQESAADINLRLAQGYLEQGRLEIAQDRINRALVLEPRNPKAFTLMGVLQEKIGDVPRAGEFFRRAAEAAPRSGVYLQNYARWLCRAERYVEAEAHFERALADPFYDTPNLALLNSAICARSSGNRDLAEARFRTVLQRHPENPEALFQLASIQFEKGQFLRARAFLQRLEAQATLGPEALHLGHDIEQEMGDSDAAQNYLRRLRETYPDSEQARSLDPSETS
jgi:type IV pilus assembly protein PilF